MSISRGLLIGALVVGLLGVGVAVVLIVDRDSDHETRAISSLGEPVGDLCERRKVEFRELKRVLRRGRLPAFAARTEDPFRFRALPEERSLPDAVLPSLIYPDKRVSIGYSDMPENLVGPGTIAEFQLSRIDRTGGFEEAVVTAEVPFDTVNQHRPYFDAPLPNRSPAIYALDVDFNRYGATLRSYRNYLYVPPGRASARLLLDRRTTSLGEGVYAAPVNTGPTALLYGVGYKLERLDDGGWAEVPLEHGLGFPAIGLVVGPGMTGECVSVGVPGDAEPGTYRVELLDGADPQGSPRSKRLPLRARFRVEEEL